jgi:subtilisin-like proprotein convertase family protein
MLISQQTNAGLGIDVDFVAWGPFASQSAMCAGISAANIVDCSYSTDAVESFTITNAQAGEWYMVLITNYSNSAGTINFTQINNGSAGAGTTNCNFINATPSACSGGNYSLSVSITGTGTLPTTGTLTLANTGGGSQVLNAPFTFPITLPNLCGNGLQSVVTAVFSDPAAATFPPVTYTAPTCATLNYSVGACSAGNYVLSGTISSSCLPSSGTVTITNSCGGSVTLNSPFSNPINWTLPSAAGDGSSCTISAVFSAANAPLISPITFDSPYCCVAEAGTTTTTYTGSSSTPNIICDGGSINIVSNDNYSLPPAGCATCIPELIYAIYTGSGPTGSDPDLDPNFSGYYWTSEDFTTAASGGYNINNGGSSSLLSQLIPSVNNTWCFVPITADAGDLPNHDNDGDACYDLGTPICFQFLNPISTTLQSVCNGVVTLSVIGGFPEFAGGNYTITNTGNGTLSSSSVASGGSFSLSGLAVGQSYSYTITAGGCSKSFTGSYMNTFNVTSTPTSTTINAGQCVTLTGNVVSTGGNISFNNLTDYAIPDGGVGISNSNPLINTGDWAISTINVYGICPSTYETGKQISVSLNISHTYDGDLNIWLQSPSGTFIRLSNGNGGSSDNYTNTIFSTTASTNITAGTAPYTGTFIPEQSFNLLNGSSINGAWKLWVGDNSSIGSGSILDWMVTVNTTPTTTYAWTPTTGLSSSTVLNPQACPTATTTYTLSATTNCGCTKTASSTITLNAASPPSAVISAQTNVNCYGQATGTATVTASAGTPAYSYSWNTIPVQTSATATGLAAGTYIVTVTDANLLTATATVTITQPASPMEIYAHGTDPSCAGVCDGNATVDVIGGTGPYSYLWSTGASTQSISSLCAGTYSVTVTDASGCTSTNSTTVPGCFQIQSILVNSCATTEWNEEMVFFQVGASALNTSSMNVTWTTTPVIPWQGLCTNPGYIAAVNATITGGGTVLPLPVSGILPANANVVLVTENVLLSPIADFSNLSGTLYMLFQCSGNAQGHFSNSAATAFPLVLSFGASCSDTVSYSTNSALSSNGGYVLYSSNGTPTYLNYGCSIPYTIQSNSVTLINSPAPAAPVVSNVSYCVGATATPLTATGSNLLWYTTATGGTGSATAPTPSTVSAGTFTYYVSQTVSSCESARATITVTVGASATATISYAGSPFCKSLTSAQAVSLSGATGGTYSSTAGLSINASTGAITPSTSTAGTYTITYTIAASGGCPAVTATTSIQIVAQPTVNAPASASICSGSNPNLALTSTPAGGTFDWTYSGGASGSGTGTPINNVLTNATCANIIVNYAITATLNGCTGLAVTVPVTVKQKPTSTFTLSSDTICINQNVILTYTGSSCPGNTFTSTFTSATVNSGSGSGPYNLSWSSPGSYPIIFQASNSGGGCTASQFKDTVVVYALPVASFTGTTSICSGQTTGIALSSTIVGTTYSWTVVQTGVSGALAGSGSSIAQTLSTTGNVSGTAVYTVTPTANGCTGTPITITITVKPTPTASYSGSTSICSGQATALTLSSNVASTTYAWTVVQSGVSGASAGSGSSIAQTLTTSSTAAGTATYTITPTANSCPGSTTTLIVNVNPVPSASTLAPSFSVCSGSTLATANSATINLFSNIPGTSYAWTGSDGTTGTGSPISYPIPNPSCSTLVVTYNVTPSYNGCNGSNINNIPLSVYPTPVSSVSVSPNPVCAGSVATVSFSGSACSSSTYNWTWPAGSSVVSGSGAGPYTVSFASVGTYSISNQVVGSAALGSCSSTTSSTSVSVVTPPNAGSNGTKAVCSNGTAVDLFSSLGGTPATGGSWSGPSTLGNGYLGTYTPGVSSAGVYTYTVTGTAPCANAIATITVDETAAPSAAIIYPGAPYCKNISVGQIPAIYGSSGGTFSASPAGLTINASTGTITPSSSAAGTYTVTYTIAASGACPTYTTTVSLTISDIPATPTLTPNPPCAGQVVNFSAGNGAWYEFTLNGSAVTIPSASNTYTSPVLVSGDQVCVNSYPTPPFILDGNITEPEWSTPFATSEGGPSSSGFGAGNNLDALYLSNMGGTFYGAIAGSIVNGSNNRVLIFIDCETGGYNSLAGWTNRTNAPYYSVENLSSSISFDAGFSPDYILSMNQAFGDAYFDLYHIATNTNNFLGQANTSSQLGYVSNSGVGDFSKGFEFAFPMTSLGNPSGVIQLFSMIVNDPGISAPTFVSNQFLTPCGSSENNYGNAAINFGSATPNPINYLISNDCYSTTCVTAGAPITPTFTQVAAICSGTSLSALPTTSINGITGTWSPALNNTATTLYTFTPTAGLCATTATMTITVNPNVTPTFTQVAAICSGASLSALPTTSNNGITGTWSPALNNTATTLYTFTPTAGLCATTATMTITVNPNVTPTFTQVAAICSGASLSALPTTSNNGITGTWSPALNNTATTLYTFTPTAGLCATTATMTITVNPNVTPTFTQVAAICSGASLSALPTTSNNGITGTWSPALNNTATTLYTFTPTAGLCATTATMTITVNPNVTPTFTALAPFCAGQTAPTLPSSSLNGITGSWSPTTVNNSTNGTYTFTPDPGQCAGSATLNSTVNPLPTTTPIYHD